MSHVFTTATFEGHALGGPAGREETVPGTVSVPRARGREGTPEARAVAATDEDGKRSP
jgi:hypothetical protein